MTMEISENIGLSSRAKFSILSRVHVADESSACICVYLRLNLFPEATLHDLSR